jgi:hypothetical protein
MPAEEMPTRDAVTDVSAENIQPPVSPTITAAKPKTMNRSIVRDSRVSGPMHRS